MTVILPMLLFRETRGIFSDGVLTVAGKPEALDSHAEISVEKILSIDTAAPSMIFGQEAIVSTKD